MATKSGVWIDHKQAIVVLVGDGEDQIKKLKSGVKKGARAANGSKVKNWYTPNDFVAEDRLQRKGENELHKFYDAVIAAILGSKSLLILGPGEAKGEFLKRLKAKKLGGVSVDVETADKMTDREIAAKVRLHGDCLCLQKSRPRPKRRQPRRQPKPRPRRRPRSQKNNSRRL